MAQRILLVTGASSDIGIDCIRRIHDNYDLIVAHYNRTEDRLVELQREIGAKIEIVQADFIQEESTLAFSDTLIKRGWDPSHILHLPATPISLLRFTKTTWSSIQESFDVALRSFVLISQKHLPSMSKARHGRIVVMLSHQVSKTSPYSTAYIIAKYALLGLIKSLALEYADKGITINGVAPAVVDTKYIDTLPESVVENAISASPLKRLLKVEEVTQGIAFLLSNAACGVNGQNLLITGGE